MTGSRPLPVASLAVACALAALLGASAAPAHDLKGRLVLLAKGGKVQDKSAEVANAVLIYRPAAAPKALSTNRTYQIATRQKEFVPRMLAVPLGSTITFPNEDPILHNVFSVSGANRFDLGLYRKGPGKSWTFKNPGAVRVFCNVHHSMVAYVYVSDSPYYTSPDPSGAFTLAGLPEGGGTVEVWHEQTEGMKRDVAANQRGPLDLQIEITRPRIPAHMNKTGKPYSKDARGDY